MNFWVLANLRHNLAWRAVISFGWRRATATTRGIPHGKVRRWP